MLENCQKLAVKQLPRKTYFTYFCENFHENLSNIVSFRLGPDSWNLHFLHILVSKKIHLLLKLIIGATEMWKKHKFDIYIKCTVCNFSFNYKINI